VPVLACRLSRVDYNEHLARESARFAEAINQAAPTAGVPSCPEWNADDLLWHLGKVQYFWGTVVLDGVDGTAAEERNPERPEGRAALQDFYHRASERLAESLAGADPAAHAWTWAPEQTIGFIQRRQAHEALIHRVDAELTAGQRTPLDPELAADGVDEGLRVMYGGCPVWGTITPEPGPPLRIRATDTGASWLVTLARFTGTDPEDGKAHDEPDIHIAAADTGEAAAAEISGAAADLDCWVWNRDQLGPVTQSGDQPLLDRFGAIMHGPIN
jgi:uncharacterized protein (TIGR03083 family)